MKQRWFLFALLLVLGAPLLAQTLLPADSLLAKTPAGFPYIRHINQGGELPQPGQFVLYHAQMRNGAQVFFSTRKQGGEPALEMPALSQEKERNTALVQLLSLMHKGDSLTAYLRVDTLKTKPKSIANTDWVAYDIVCLDILSKAEWERRQSAQGVDHEQLLTLMDSLISAYKNKNSRAQMPLETTRSGLKYLLLQEGTGHFPTKGKNVAVHYAGFLRSGKLVDSSTKEGKPFIFLLSQGVVIEGWDEGVPLLREGSEAVFFIPAKLAYGEQGSPPNVPPNAEMIYYIKVVKVP
ncbi:MAG: FKBP-type peptidyl-prolyl cis-trans isomerase [Saprospiraceae bacterium]